ncbi:Hypothetical protein HVR_LOCUS379 [uncultured virus]|nr:Hypothetical protein HVR_LOCUS379 [uncultured virus]
MGVFTLYVPKSNLENYKKYVLERIYSFKGDDFWFLNSNEEKDHDSIIRLDEETDEHYNITFRFFGNITLCNVLPETLVTQGRIFYFDQEKLKQIRDYLKYELTTKWELWEQHQNEIYEYQGTKPSLTVDELPNIIKQLATDGDIQKYYQLTETMFVCVGKGFELRFRDSGVDQLYIGILNGKLFVMVGYGPDFDIDDGFFVGRREYDDYTKFLEELRPEYADTLNEHFKAWQEKDDLSAIIIPPNDIRE